MNPEDTHIEEETTTAEEETEEVESEETVDAETEESEEEDSESGSEEEVIDWKKVAENETAARKKAEQALAKRRLKEKQGDTEDLDDADEEFDEDKPLTSRQLEKILARERANTRREMQSSQTKELAKGLTESDDEASAVIAIHSNRIWPEGTSLEQQVRESYFIAHGERLLAKRDELRRAVRSKQNASKSGNENTHRDSGAKAEPKINGADRAEMQRLGFKWDGKRFIKNLGTGKTLVRDHNTGKTFVESNK